MPRMPAAQFVGEKSPERLMTRWDIVCIHTIVGSAPHGTESHLAHLAHFSTRADGRILQSRDTRFRSGANQDGNHRIIAIENEDRGPAFGEWNINDPHAVPAFTAAQIEAIAQICAWANSVHGVPLVACPDSRPASRGIAYHRQGIDGNFSEPGFAFPGRVSGGEVWTEMPRGFGKPCPGDRRIAQIPAIIARAQQIASGTPPIRKVPTMFLVMQADTDRVWAITGDGRRRFVATRGALDALKAAGVPFNPDTSWTSKLLQSFPQEPNSDITDRRP